jgi:hypothetical protein
MAQERLHFFGTHLLRVPDAMKPDVTLYPVHIDRFSARTVAAGAHGFADPVPRHDSVYGASAALIDLSNTNGDTPASVVGENYERVAALLKIRVD